MPQRMNRHDDYSGKKKGGVSKDDEVDDLLRAAHDDVLIKLSLNSHIAHLGTSSSIDPDLDSRFQALKARQSKSKSSKLDASQVTIVSEKKNPEKVLRTFDESDDLFARFAALKGSSLPSLPSHPSSAADVGGRDEVRQLVNDDGEDEVEKVIKWAIDAARLDPSPPSDSDTEEGGVDDDDLSDDSDDDDHRKVDSGTKSIRK